MSKALSDPADCISMTQVRQGVDAIDQELVALLTKRQAYMDAAARIKTQRTGGDQSRPAAHPADADPWATPAQPGEPPF